MFSRQLTRFVILSAALTLSGCATIYQGPGPRLGLTSPGERQREYESFKIEERHFLLQTGASEMNHESYAVGSLQPFMERVSPQSAEYFSSAKTWRQATLLSGLASIGFAVSAFFVPNSATGPMLLAALGAVGLEISFGTAQVYNVAKAIKVYNRDLKYSLQIP